MDDLEGKNASITGGASGIGFAIAKASLNEGMNFAGFKNVCIIAVATPFFL